MAACLAAPGASDAAHAGGELKHPIDASALFEGSVARTPTCRQESRRNSRQESLRYDAESLPTRPIRQLPTIGGSEYYWAGP